MAEFHPLRSKHDLENDPAWEILNAAAEKLARNEPTASLPSLDHLTYSDYQNVYEPADDTYLLTDCLQYEFRQGQFRIQNCETSANGRITRVLEIGGGSGVPSVFFRMQWNELNTTTTLSPRAIHSIVTDVNPYALQATMQTAAANGIDIQEASFQTIQCDLASDLLPAQAGKVDVILFNPPYVPTPDEEVGGTGIEASWAGGIRGRRVVDRAVGQMAQLLRKPNGVAYMITVDDNRPVELSGLFGNVGLTMRPLFRRRAHNEYLTVQKLTWSAPILL